jgi:DNA-binding NarL/FixJ family response regulator
VPDEDSRIAEHGHVTVVIVDDVRARYAVAHGLSAAGFEVAGEVAPGGRVFMLTRSEEHHVVEAVLVASSGVVLESAPAEAIIGDVGATAAGESVLAPQIAATLLERIREREMPFVADSDAAAAIRAALTDRELEILSRLTTGKTNSEMAADLHLSSSTVSSHVANILLKLQLENRVQAAVHAVRSGIS